MAALVGSPPHTIPDTFMKAVCSQPGAPAALRTLTDAGLNDVDLFDWLWVVAKFERLRGGRRELRRNPIAGMPLYEFDRLPEKVRGWAQEISRINSGLTAHPVTAHLDEFLTAKFPPSLSRLTRKDRQEMLKRFRMLPDELIVYSGYLKVLAKMYRYFWGNVRTGLEGLREAFVLWVKEGTGSQHYQQLATLLSAAYYAVGLRQQEYVLNET